MGPDLLQNYNRLKFSFSFEAHLHPNALHTAVAVYEFGVTRIVSEQVFCENPFPSESSCSKSSISMQKFILQLSSCCFQELVCDYAGQTCFFSLLLCPICCCQRYLAVEDAVWLSRRRILSVFVSEELVL